MTTMEKKLDVCLRFITAPGAAERKEVAQEARELLQLQDGSACVDKDNMLRHTTEDLLTQVGVPLHIKGYGYLVSGIVRLINDPDEYGHNQITKQLYPSIAEEFHATTRQVERCIRHAVEYAFDNADMDVLGKLFGNSISANKGKATNGQFMMTLAREVQRRICAG